MRSLFIVIAACKVVASVFYVFLASVAIVAARQIFLREREG